MSYTREVGVDTHEPTKAAALLREEGLSVGVVNARFAKPLDRPTVLKALAEAAVVVSVEEGTLEGGFGSAVLEAANAAGVGGANVLRLGLPDRFVEHAERGELLADLGLDAAGLANAARRRLAAGCEREEAEARG